MHRSLILRFAAGYVLLNVLHTGLYAKRDDLQAGADVRTWMDVMGGQSERSQEIVMKNKRQLREKWTHLKV
jgi:hypothetical protein